MRTAQVHAVLREAPLRALREIQRHMCSLVLFTCNECRVRFPAWRPDDVPDVDLQVVHACPNAVALWDELEAVPADDRMALRCSGLCGQCNVELEKVKDDAVLSGVTRLAPATIRIL